jgi:protein TonB
LYPDAVADRNFPSWEPKELGTARPALLAVVICAMIAGVIYYAADVLTPPKQPEVIQITQAQLTAVPQPTPPPPPPPPKVVPPPKPLPVTIPKPPPIPSKIVVATKPPPPVHRVVKHIPKPIPHVEQPTPPPVTQPPPTPAPPQAPAVRTDGIGPYGSVMHNIIQANQDVPPALAQLGVSGTAIIHVVVAPDGHVISASVVKSSGVSLIDSTALDHVRNAVFPPFNANMPNQTIPYDVPVEIDGEDASNN